MGNEEADRNKDPENIKSNGSNPEEEKNKFNEGGNASDYDGGHPKDVYAESEGRINSSDEHSERKKKSNKETNANDEHEFNAGGNDSDYDGGHPKDAFPESEGRIDSNNDNPGK